MLRSPVQQIAVLAGIAVWPLLSTVAIHAEDAPKLRYGFQADHKYAYEIKITASFQDIEMKREGVLTYDVKSAKEDQFTVKVTGDLGSQVTGGMPRFPHFPMRPFPGPRGPFGVRRPTDWTLNRQGGVVIYGPIEQIPLLLGPKELLIFERLPNDAKASWELGGDIGILEKGQQEGVPHNFPGTQQETGHGAGERAEYAVTETTPEIVRMTKKYHLSSEPAEKETQFVMTGSGELVFDRKEGVFKSCSMKYEIEANEKNVKRTMPVTVSYRLFTDEELAAHEAKQKEEAEARKKAAEPKAVSDEERAALLADLRSKDDKKIDAALDRLGKGIVDDHAEEISAAVLPFLKAANNWRQMKAVGAMKVWAMPSAENALIQLSKEENVFLRGPAVESLGRMKTATAAAAAAAQMPKCRGEVGKALRAIGPSAEKYVWPWLNDRDFWVRVESRKILKDIGTKASIPYLRKDSESAATNEQKDAKDAIAAIEERAAQGGEAESNDSAATETAESDNASGEIRTWSDASGLFKVEAELAGVADGKVALKKADGSTVHVPITKLSEKDQAWVKEHAQEGTGNPFQ